jgi:thiol-disulfide isomerase/thioredoxin
LQLRNVEDDMKHLILLLMLGACLPAQTVQRIRLKLSAGDLPSAESVLELHRLDHGKDDEYLKGLSWLARGGALLGDWQSAARYSREAKAVTEAILAGPKGWEANSSAVYALGSALETDAQRIATESGPGDAADMIEARLARYENAPVAFRSRLHKRLNMLSLAGKPAPELQAEHAFGRPHTPFSDGNGPTVIFGWAQWCPDAKAQVRMLAKAVEKFEPEGVRFVALTRFYTSDRDREKTKILEVWNDAYAGLGDVPVIVSGDAMLRYGVSSTPTFVFIDRSGIVRRYLPTSLTFDRLSSEIERLSTSAVEHPR